MEYFFNNILLFLYLFKYMGLIFLWKEEGIKERMKTGQTERNTKKRKMGGKCGTKIDGPTLKM